ncbi:hypothetical protein BH10PSE14_BH10PSE14_19350 [soil metagenome]
MRWFVLIFVALASGSLAQESPTPPIEGDTIVVTGRSGGVTRSYVDRVARPEPGRQLARWNAPLCIKYDGLDEKYAHFIQGRIAETARNIGLKMAGPNCPTAVIVKLTDQADALTSALLHSYPLRLGSVTSGTHPSKRLIAALEAPRTVRWLAASATVNQDGTPINAVANQVRIDSLIRSATREDMDSKIILIDEVRLVGVSLNQLADYIAFITLASPDAAADFAGTDSIMALFAGAGPGPARMTGQDLAFLDALYAVPADRAANVQKGAIRARIAKGKTRARNKGGE